MRRNYLRDIASLGISKAKIAKQLGASPFLTSAYIKGTKTPPKADYEKVRNVYRRMSYGYLRKAGFPSSAASQRRRMIPTALYEERVWLDDVVDVVWAEWNSKHPDPSDPLHLSKAEVKKRIVKGIESGKSKEEIEETY